MSGTEIKAAEIDEMHSDIVKENYCWTWIAIDRDREKRSVALLASETQKQGWAM
ncbi:MAG: hypothetical protein R8M38_08335 [Mariprofundaceae bacterium]